MQAWLEYIWLFSVQYQTIGDQKISVETIEIRDTNLNKAVDDLNPIIKISSRLWMFIDHTGQERSTDNRNDFLLRGTQFVIGGVLYRLTDEETVADGRRSSRGKSGSFRRLALMFNPAEIDSNAAFVITNNVVNTEASGYTVIWNNCFEFVDRENASTSIFVSPTDPLPTITPTGYAGKMPVANSHQNNHDYVVMAGKNGAFVDLVIGDGTTHNNTPDITALTIYNPPIDGGYEVFVCQQIISENSPERVWIEPYGAASFSIRQRQGTTLALDIQATGNIITFTVSRALQNQ